MSSIKQNSIGSVSECDTQYTNLDEKKRKRMVSNRESARRSRMRKQKKLLDLTEEVGRLQAKNNEITGNIDGISRKYMILVSENNVLRAQERELSERLMALNNMIVGSGSVVAESQLSDPPLKSCQFPCSMQAIVSSSTFQF